jgi:hypothetical protein
LLQAAPAPPPAGLTYRDFEDQVRCRFILEEVCARLINGDRKGASAFVGVPEVQDFRDLPDNQGAIKTCRGVLPAKKTTKGPGGTLLLSYASGGTQEVGLRFGVLGGRTCGYISALSAGLIRFIKDGKTYVSDFLSTRSFQADAEDSDVVARVRPEQDGAPPGPAPREVYIGKVLEQIKAERERRQAEKDPLSQPLIRIQKE